MATMKIFTLNLSGKTASLSLPTGLSVVQCQITGIRTLRLVTYGDQSAQVVQKTVTLIEDTEAVPAGSSVVGCVDWSANLAVSSPLLVRL